MNSAPIFIGGLDRSGKTYMRLMLDSHPRIAMSKRANLWPQYYRRFGSLQSDVNIDRCLEALSKRKHIRNLQLDFERLRLDFMTGPRNYERLFELIHTQYAGLRGKSRWGDQTELLEKYASPIMAAYPNAKFIHMIRDPRDRYEAVLQKSQRRGGVGAATARWLYSAALARENQLAYPKRYKVVRYEAMVVNPDETMQDVCNFLGEEYHPAMLQMGNASRFNHLKPGEETDRFCPLSRDYIGRFKTKLYTGEIFFIQKLSKSCMRWFDYPIEPIRLSWRESFQYYTFHWLANAARMMAWKMRNMAVR